MADPTENSVANEESGNTTSVAEGRRPVLKKLGRFAVVTAPAVTLLLAAKSKPASAAPASPSPASSRQFKITEGAVDSAAALASVMSPGVGSAAVVGTIDGVGLSLAAIKGLARRIDDLEIALSGR